MSDSQPSKPAKPDNTSLVIRVLDRIEWLGNKLPDPAILFLIGMILTWLLSAWLSTITFSETIPGSSDPIQIENLLTFPKFAGFLAGMVEEFTGFHPLGVVLVAMLGVGIADYSGFLNACMKSLLNVAPGFMLTPLLILVAIISHTAADAGYVLVIPIGGVMFYAAGRHPLAGIAAAFAGVSGGFSANFIPSGIDPLLAGLTQAGVSIVDETRTVNPLCNIFFTAASSILIILVGWFLTDRIVEPRLSKVAIDGDPNEMPKIQELSSRDKVAMWLGLGSILAGVVALTLWALPADSSLRAADVDRTLTSLRPPAPLMQSIVPLIFLFFAVPGIVYGYVSGNFKNHRDVVKGMSTAMETMGYYLVLVFFAALFIAAFRDSNIGNLVAIKGANFIRESGCATMGYDHRNYLVVGGGQPFGRVSVGKMGDAGSHLRSDVDVRGHLTRIDSSGLSSRRFNDKYYHSDDALLPIGGRFLSALCQADGDWNGGRDDVAILGDLLDPLDVVPVSVLGLRHAVGFPSPVRIRSANFGRWLMG